MTQAQEFRRQAEQDAYRFLHVEGRDAFEDEYGMAAASGLLSVWQDLGFVKISYVESGTYVDSRGDTRKNHVQRVRTFKKYLDPKYVG